MKPLSPENKFFLIFISTILVTRIILFIAGVLSDNPDSLGLTFFGFRLHHYMYGLVLLTLGITLANMYFYALGLGLFADELAYLLLGGQNHADNYSVISLAGTILVVVMVFRIRKYLLRAIRLKKGTDHHRSETGWKIP